MKLQNPAYTPFCRGSAAYAAAHPRSHARACVAQSHPRPHARACVAQSQPRPHARACVAQSQPRSRMNPQIRGAVHVSGHATPPHAPPAHTTPPAPGGGDRDAHGPPHGTRGGGGRGRTCDVQEAKGVGGPEATDLREAQLIVAVVVQVPDGHLDGVRRAVWALGAGVHGPPRHEHACGTGACELGGGGGGVCGGRTRRCGLCHSEGGATGASRAQQGPPPSEVEGRAMAVGGRGGGGGSGAATAATRVCVGARPTCLSPCEAPPPPLCQSIDRPPGGGRAGVSGALPKQRTEHVI